MCHERGIEVVGKTDTELHSKLREWLEHQYKGLPEQVPLLEYAVRSLVYFPTGKDRLSEFAEKAKQ